MRNFWRPLLPSLISPLHPSPLVIPCSSLPPTSVMPSYLCLQSHWDNCTPIMEKLVGPEMSLSPSLSLSALRGRTLPLALLCHIKPWRAAGGGGGITAARHPPQISFHSAASCLPLPSAAPASYYNITLMSHCRCFMTIKKKIKWNKKRCSGCQLKKVACPRFFISPWKCLYQTYWSGFLVLRYDRSFKKWF